jgi:cytochrome P450
MVGAHRPHSQEVIGLTVKTVCGPARLVTTVRRQMRKRDCQLPPGPGLPAPAQTLWFTFDQLGFWASCRRRYGPTFTIRLAGFPPIVVTSDRDAVRRLFTGDALLRRHGNDFLKPVFGARSLFFLEPAEHVARRRTELPPFHGSAVRTYGERISELAAAEIARWRPGGVVATHPRARALTLKLIMELVLGVRDRALGEEITSIMDWLSSPVGNLALFAPPSLTQRAWWSRTASPAYARVERLHALLGQQIARSRADRRLGERTDVLALLVRSQHECGSALSDADLRDDVVTLVVAGHEPTATAIAWACDLLARNPAVCARLRDGDRSYLAATVQEVLRIRPALPLCASRHALEPFAIGDWSVDPAALIFVDAVGIHSNPELHPHPDAFRPERFLEHPPDGYAHVPFGGGAHRCLGAALATLELERFLEALVSRIEIAPVGPPRRPTRRGPTLGPAREGRVRVTSLIGRPGSASAPAGAARAPAGASTA